MHYYAVCPVCQMSFWSDEGHPENPECKLLANLAAQIEALKATVTSGLQGTNILWPTICCPDCGGAIGGFSCPVGDTDTFWYQVIVYLEYHWCTCRPAIERAVQEMEEILNCFDRATAALAYGSKPATEVRPAAHCGTSGQDADWLEQHGFSCGYCGQWLTFTVSPHCSDVEWRAARDLVIDRHDCSPSLDSGYFITCPECGERYWSEDGHPEDMDCKYSPEMQPEDGWVVQRKRWDPWDGCDEMNLEVRCPHCGVLLTYTVYWNAPTAKREAAQERAIAGHKPNCPSWDSYAASDGEEGLYGWGRRDEDDGGYDWDDWEEFDSRDPDEYWAALGCNAAESTGHREWAYGW